MTVAELQERRAYNTKRLAEKWVFHRCPFPSDRRTTPKLLVATSVLTTSKSLRRTPSTSAYVQRILAEQAAIERRLNELGVDDIRQKLNKTSLESLDTEEKMNIDQPQAQQEAEPRPIGAKQRALAKFVSSCISSELSCISGLTSR